MGQTAIEKIVERHLADGPPSRPVRSGDFVSIRPHHVMTHDNTAAVMNKFKALGAPRFFDPKQPVFTLDHDIQNESEANLTKYRNIAAFAKENGVDFHPAGRGIGHQVMVEEGYVIPGSLVVASDSHSNMYGAMGALGTPVVRTDAAAIWAGGEFWWQVPRCIQVALNGTRRSGVTGKDVIAALCGLYNQGEVLNAAVEFTGPGAADLSLEERLTISNMTTEWGALVGWFEADGKTISFLENRFRELGERGKDRFSQDQLESWRTDPLRADDDAVYSARIELDLGEVTPSVLGPDNVQTMTLLAEMEERQVAIQKAYIVSCVNSRLGDLEAAAAVLKGKTVAPGVELYVAPASRVVLDQAEGSGVWQTLLDAGAKPLPPGCGPCIGLGTGLLEAGEIGISATNRNFKGRMGSRDAQCYLASPAVVAASAVAGHIRAPEEWKAESPTRKIETISEPGATEAASVEILPGFPEELAGRLVFVPQDNLNTDGIYGKDYTYREDMTPEMMAEVVMENYDPEFAARTQRGDILVGGYNFGTGSSREQAATALLAKGIPTVIAGSFSQTYLRNAFNNGFPCIASPGLVDHMRALVAKDENESERTLIYTSEIKVDFKRARITWRGESFTFSPLGKVPQSLVVAGGVENLVRERLGLK